MSLQWTGSASDMLELINTICKIQRKCKSSVRTLGQLRNSHKAFVCCKTRSTTFWHSPNSTSCCNNTSVRETPRRVACPQRSKMLAKLPRWSATFKILQETSDYEHDGRPAGWTDYGIYTVRSCGRGRCSEKLCSEANETEDLKSRCRETDEIEDLETRAAKQTRPKFWKPMPRSWQDRNSANLRREQDKTETPKNDGARQTRRKLWILTQRHKRNKKQATLSTYGS